VRIQVSVPQTYVPSLRAGSTAQVTVRELPGRTFTGIVALRAGAMDAASRTQLVEVHLSNPGLVLVPGMYADVQITPAHPAQTIQIPGSALVNDAQGTRVASITPQGTVHYLRVKVVRDLGTMLDIASGLRGNETLVDNPSDSLTEGDAVKVVTPQDRPREGAAPARAG
jgi:RND family efflux transporter MFP subunit